jgi:hypothetical protein
LKFGAICISSMGGLKKKNFIISSVFWKKEALFKRGTVIKQLHLRLSLGQLASIEDQSVESSHVK